MVIGIYDEDSAWLLEAARWVEERGLEIGEPVQSYGFQTVQELLNHKGEPFELLLVNIAQAPEGVEPEGIRLAKEINSRVPQCQIAYMTEHLQYATRVYHTDHCHFLLKQELRSRLPEVLGKVMRLRAPGNTSCLFAIKGGGEVRLAPSELRYFERDMRMTRMFTAWGSYCLAEKLDDLQKMLPDAPLIRCHNSYLVHLGAVRELHRENLVLTDGTKIPVSRVHRKAVQDAFAQWNVLNKWL